MKVSNPMPLLLATTTTGHKSQISITNHANGNLSRIPTILSHQAQGVQYNVT